MNLRYRLLKSVGLAGILALAGADACLGGVLSVPYYYQKQDQWCWNASCQMVLSYKGHLYAQTTIANWAVGGKNIPNYLYGSTATDQFGCDQVLRCFGGVSSTPVGRALSKTELTAEIAGIRPVFIRWGWDSGGGHILLARGINNNSVYINDPWYANGQSVQDYSWVYKGGGHTWTHSLKVANGSASEPYYKKFVKYYNTAMQYFNYGGYVGTAYGYKYYAYAAYYYLYYGNRNLATSYYNYYMSGYYYYAYLYYLTYATSYLDYAYACQYYAYYAWYWYTAYGNSSAANYYYNLGMEWAYYYYYLWLYGGNA